MNMMATSNKVKRHCLSVLVNLAQKVRSVNLVSMPGTCSDLKFHLLSLSRSIGRACEVQRTL